MTEYKVPRDMRWDGEKCVPVEGTEHLEIEA